MLRASLGKVVHTVKRAGTYAAKVPPQELHKIAVHVRAVPATLVKSHKEVTKQKKSKFFFLLMEGSGGGSVLVTN
jgi:hypothetical protein